MQTEAGVFTKKGLWHRCFTANFAKFLRTACRQNTSSCCTISIQYCGKIFDIRSFFWSVLNMEIPNTGKTDQKKLRIWTLSAKCKYFNWNSGTSRTLKTSITGNLKKAFHVGCLLESLINLCKVTNNAGT